MTKEEFLNMVYAEIDRLKEVQKHHNNLIIIYEKLLQNNPSSQDYKEKLEQSKYNLEIIKNTITQLNHFLKYPIYARINAMSDLEVDEYKQSKITECEGKKDTLNTQKASLLETHKTKKREMNDIIEQFTSEKTDHEKVLQLDESIQTISSRITEIDEELSSLEEQLNFLRTRSLHEIKFAITNKQREYNFYSLLRNNSNNFRIANSQDAKKLAQLFSERARIKNAFRKLYVSDLFKHAKNFVGDDLLADSIKQYENLQINSSLELDKFDMLVTELEGKLNTLEKKFNEKFNSKMISRLEKITRIEGDFEFAITIYHFLKENNFLDIKDEDHVVIEQALMKIKEYEKSRRSIFNRKKYSLQSDLIKYISYRIKEIYRKFAGLNFGIIVGNVHEYERDEIGRIITMRNVPGITGMIEVDLNSSDNMHRSIKRILEKMFCKDDDNVITRARNDVQKLRQNEAEIRKILGFDFDLFISNNSLFSDSSLDQQRNYNGIVLSSSQYNVNEFLNKVDNEVQKDIGKAELLNISLEELRSKEVINNDLQIDEVDSSYVPASRKK